MTLKKNIVLIGFMGTGKTVTGKVLARRLKRPFVELDREIVKRAGKSIPQIFADDGEPHFRKLESREARRAARRRGIVVSTGGGIVLKGANVRALRKNGILVYLTASPETIFRRTAGNRGRPLLRENPFQNIKKLLKFRRPLYRRAADITVGTNGLTDVQTAEIILKRLKKWE